MSKNGKKADGGKQKAAHAFDPKCVCDDCTTYGTHTQNCDCAKCTRVREAIYALKPKNVECVRDLSAADALDLIEMDEAIGKAYSCAAALLRLRNHKASERTPQKMKELASEIKAHCDRVLQEVA